MYRRFLPLIATLVVLACVSAIVAFAASRGNDHSVGTVEASPSATALARGTDAPAASELASATPDPTVEPTPEPTVAPTEAPPPPPPTRAPTPRPTATPNPNALSISGRVSDQAGAAYGGVCVTIGPPIRCATTSAANGTYYVSLDSAPPGIAWDVRYLVGGDVKVERLGVIVSGPVVINVVVPR